MRDTKLGVKLIVWEMGSKVNKASVTHFFRNVCSAERLEITSHHKGVFLWQNHNQDSCIQNGFCVSLGKSENRSTHLVKNLHSE